VKRLFASCLAVPILMVSSGCGNVFVRGTLNGPTLSMSGLVSVVQLTTVIDHGSAVTVTLVTFLHDGTSSSMNFCGDQRGQFPLDQFVRAQFTETQSCASWIVVLIG